MFIVDLLSFLSYRIGKLYYEIEKVGFYFTGRENLWNIIKPQLCNIFEHPNFIQDKYNELTRNAMCNEGRPWTI